MKRKIFLQLLLPVAGLGVLFLLLAFSPNQNAARPALLEMSVILRESDPAVLRTTRQGMEQAAADLNVELRVLISEQSQGAEEQAALLRGELERGAGAILLWPSDRAALARSVAEAAERAVVVTVETDMTDLGADGSVTLDNEAVGKALGNAALNGVGPEGTVLLLDAVPGDNGVTRRRKAAEEVLRAEGRKVISCRPGEGETVEEALKRVLDREEAGVVLAFEAASLERAAELARTGRGFPLLYGAGSTSSIAAALEQGYITAIAAKNEFTVGYLAVETAAGLARKETVERKTILPFLLIRQESMYEPEHQKLLFPVTK